MKHIHLVVPFNSIAMQRMAAPFKAADGFPLVCKITQSETPDPKADLNYYLPWRALIEPVGKSVIHYTHFNPGDDALLENACAKADKIIAMSFTGRNELLAHGADPRKTWVIYSGTEHFSLRRRNIGVIGYIQPTGRKRENLLIDLAWMLDKDTQKCIQWAIAGNGWGSIVEQLKTMNVNVTHFEHLEDTTLQQFYNQLDLLLITGHAEGGPLPLIEALACGVPVISPPFGYANDLLDDKYIYRSDIDLRNKIVEFVRPAKERHKLTRLFGWADYAMDHAMIFGELLNTAIDIIPQLGRPRYDNMLGIVDRIKPRTICEIGTWTGLRATQMIQIAARYRPVETIEYTGFDLFEEQTDEQFWREDSKYAEPRHLVAKRIEATGARVNLIQGNTRDTLAGCPAADFYFIDGGHSLSTIRSDWAHISMLMGNGTVVFDDYYDPEIPEMGCNQIIDNLGKDYIVEKLPVITKTPDKNINMVMVKRKNANLHIPMQERPRISREADYAGCSSYAVPSLSSDGLASSPDSDGKLERSKTESRRAKPNNKKSNKNRPRAEGKVL